MNYLITGGCGFLGTNLSSEVLKNDKNNLYIIDNLSRHGSEINLKWLKTLGSLKHYKIDISIFNDVEQIIKSIKPEVIFHLSGQVAMTTSLSNPRLDFNTNVIGGHNVLESVRLHSPNSIVIYSSTNKVYGDLASINFTENDTRYIAKNFVNGFDETLPLSFESPYGCSKGTIDQYMLDYYRMYGIKTVVFRHSSIFGGRQFSTIDQGWIGWFCDKALKIKNNIDKTDFEIFGNGKQVRDVLFASDLINCYFKAVDEIDITKGNAYNIGGGFKNSLSLIELFKELEELLQITMSFKEQIVRKSDQKVFIANFDKAKNDFGWEPKVDYNEGLSNMLVWLNNSNI